MGGERSEAVSSPSVLRKILPVMVALATLAHLTFLLTDGSANSRFIQVGAVLGLLVYIATFVDIILGLAFLIAAVGFSPEMTVAGQDQLRLEDFVLPALLVAWLTRVAQRRTPFTDSRIKGPALAYVAVIVTSSLLGVATGTTTSRMALLMLGKFIEYYLIFLLFLENVRTLAEFKGLTIFAILVALGGSFLEWDGMLAGYVGEQARVHGPSGETANIYGGYLMLSLSLLIGLYLHADTGPQRLATGLGIVLLGRALLFTYSRTSYVALLLALVTFAVVKAPRLLLVLAIVTALFPLFAPGAVLARASTITGVVAGPDPASWSARTAAWQQHVDRLSGPELLLGRGLGSVKSGDVDSEYVRILVDTGLLGLAAFLWFLFRVGRVAHGIYESIPPGTFAKGFTAGFLIAFVAIAVHSIAATSFTAIRTMECFMILAGLMVALANRAAEWGLAELRIADSGLRIEGPPGGSGGVLNPQSEIRNPQ